MRRKINVCYPWVCLPNLALKVRPNTHFAPNIDAKTWQVAARFLSSKVARTGLSAALLGLMLSALVGCQSVPAQPRALSASPTVVVPGARTATSGEAIPSPLSVTKAMPDVTSTPKPPPILTVDKTPAKATTTMSPPSTGSSSSFDARIYPPSLPVAHGVVLSLSNGCPNPTGVQTVNQVPVAAVQQILTALGTGDLNAMRRVSDRAFWPLLKPDQWRRRYWPADWIGTPAPAQSSPYAGPLISACGKQIVDQSWWVKLCPGPCQDPKVAASQSLTGHIYLIKRLDHWLIWAAK